MLNWKDNSLKRLIRNTFYTVSIAGIVYSCASIGRPDGGEYDETPPRFIGSTPTAGAVNNTRTRISIEFDEFIKLEKANEKVVISPPQLRPPEIKASGKRIDVNLKDTLKPNTTYTIDFADAIVDNNEGNPLGNFTFTFSTGEAIDTMAISGTLLEAANLEPIKGMLVGLHSNLADSAFTTLPLDRVSRTDSRGRYTIRGVAPGTYRLFGLMDADQNFIFSQKSEAIAFYDSLIIPRFEERIRQDTMWKDSLTIDTIIQRNYTHYLPDDAILRSFKEEVFSQRLVKSERIEPNKFALFFSAKADTLPTLTGLNFDEKGAFVIEKNQRNDTINYWIKDSLIYKMDTLRLQLNYLHSDTLNRLVERTDTLRLATRRARGAANEESSKKEDSGKRKRGRDKDKEEEPEPTVFLNMKADIPASMDVYGAITLTFDEPIARYDTAAIHLRQKVDTLWQDINYVFEQDSLDIKKYNLYHDWIPETEYQFEMDSLAFYGLYGLHTDKKTQAIKVKSMDDYGAIMFNVTGADSIAFVELLDPQDKVVRKRPVINGQADFYFLAPAKYGARLVNDTNGNGVWDTGNYEENRQPEVVYYYWQLIDVRVRMEFEQDWNLHSHPLDKQKPDELKKQKPDEEKKRPTRERDRSSTPGRQRQQQR